MSGRVRLLLAACGWLCAVACQAAPDFAAERASADARYAAAWVLAGADNRDLPFAVVDKRDARIYVFDAGGRLVGASAVLLGITPGDFSVGIDRAPASLSLAERTTPAGRFEARPGRNDKGEDIVWIDYAASLAIHRLRPAPVQERRPARLASPTPGRQPDLRRLRHRAGGVLRSRSSRRRSAAAAASSTCCPNRTRRAACSKRWPSTCSEPPAARAGRRESISRAPGRPPGRRRCRWPRPRRPCHRTRRRRRAPPRRHP